MANASTLQSNLFNSAKMWYVCTKIEYKTPGRVSVILFKLYSSWSLYIYSMNNSC